MRIPELIAVAALGAGLNVASPTSSAEELYYTTVNFPVSEILAIKVHEHGKRITTQEVGPTGAVCATLAMSEWGMLYSVCGAAPGFPGLFGTQQLATIDLKTGHANLFGVPTLGLAIMSLTFGPDGTLYAVGDCNVDLSDPRMPACGPKKGAYYNSLYKINVSTGVFTRIGSTGAPEYFMDLAFDRHGRMFGVTTTLSPTGVPAILYRLNPVTGAATKVADLIGSSQVMGIAFGGHGRLYGTDFMNVPGFYLVDVKTGFETAIGSLPIGGSSNLALIKADDDDEDED